MSLDGCIHFPVLHSDLQPLMIAWYEESVKCELLIFVNLIGVTIHSSPTLPSIIFQTMVICLYAHQVQVKRSKRTPLYSYLQ